VRDKFRRVEDHLHYLLERQKRRQARENIQINDIVAVAGVCSVLEWKELKGALDGQGRIESPRLPLCTKLAQAGRLLFIFVKDSYHKTVALDAKVLKCMHHQESRK
jgi:hypothetical protein